MLSQYSRVKISHLKRISIYFFQLCHIFAVKKQRFISFFLRFCHYIGTAPGFLANILYLRAADERESTKNSRFHTIGGVCAIYLRERFLHTHPCQRRLSRHTLPPLPPIGQPLTLRVTTGGNRVIQRPCFQHLQRQLLHIYPPGRLLHPLSRAYPRQTTISLGQNLLPPRSANRHLSLTFCYIAP